MADSSTQYNIPAHVDASSARTEAERAAFPEDFFLNNIHSIGRLLAKHFHERHFAPFREMQALTGLVISGSTVLNFLTAGNSQSKDLDLYVDLRGAEYVAAWLLLSGCVAQFQLEPLSFQRLFRRKLQELLRLTLEDVRSAASPEIQARMAGIVFPDVNFWPSSFVDGCYYTSPHILTVVDFTSVKETKIQLVICIGDVMDCILRFHSSHVMNFATAHSCYCLFPQETIKMKLSLAFNADDKKVKCAHKKYRYRGWRYIKNEVAAQRHAGSIFQAGSRLVGSHQSLIVPILPAMPRLSRRYDFIYGSARVNLQYEFFGAGKPFINHKLIVIPTVRVVEVPDESVDEDARNAATDAVA